jgi:hypothetical protein
MYEAQKEYNQNFLSKENWQVVFQRAPNGYTNAPV